jgi:hypothetical protein
MPESAAQTHADCLKLMKDDNYHGTNIEPLFGTGQGSGASPSVWLTLVVVLMNTLDRLIPEHMSFQSPDSPQQHDRLLDALIDDTSLGFTDDGRMTMENMIAKLNHIAQTWENILLYSGGTLNLSKCSWYIMFWEWKNGRPNLRQNNMEDLLLTLMTQGDQTKEFTIKRLSTSMAIKILGIHLAPDGNFSKQLTALKSKDNELAI